jgi:hypothetical protein
MKLVLLFTLRRLESQFFNSCYFYHQKTNVFSVCLPQVYIKLYEYFGKYSYLNYYAEFMMYGFIFQCLSYINFL